MEFAVQNFTLGDPGQTHLHFYVDADPVRYDFYNGASGNPDQGVQQNGLHSHFVHWASPTSIQMFGVAPGAHSARFVLAQANHSELTNPEATQTRNFSVSTPPAGEFTLQAMLTGLNFPLSMAFAPDGRLFYNEWTTGRIRVVQPNFGAASTFFTVSNLVTGGERGLLGLALDPAFATNRFVYAYYTASNPLRNKIIRLTDSNNVGTNETVVVDNLPASSGNHNGGVIQFGPDGKLYVVLGDVENPSSSQNTTA
ncbi:MAG: PQQ-dependent sugar dehydrogenase, partial [Burkholderiales bacterium]